MNTFARLAIFPLALSLGAAPAEQVIPIPGSPGLAIVVPAGSPVKFQHFDEYSVARFSGRFVLSGKFSYGCSIECDGPDPESQLDLTIFPDAAIQSLLPHWKDRGGDMAIYISDASAVTNEISTKRERAALLAGKLSEVRGRITIVVEDFQTSLECDSVFNSARFVALDKVQKIARLEPLGGAGCG